MKKVLSVILAALILISCAFAEADITGEWYGLMQGIPAVFTINQDGTYTVAAGNDGMDGVWELNGVDLTLDKGTSGEVVFTYDERVPMITMVVNGTAIMTFTREPVKMWQPADVNAEAALEDFAGLWDSDMVGGRGTYVEPDVVGLGLVVEISGTHVVLMPLTLAGSGDTVDPTYEADGVYENGVLTVTAPAIVGREEEMVYTITMLQDGMMAIAFDVGANTFIYYMNAF